MALVQSIRDGLMHLSDEEMQTLEDLLLRLKAEKEGRRSFESPKDLQDGEHVFLRVHHEHAVYVTLGLPRTLSEVRLKFEPGETYLVDSRKIHKLWQHTSFRLLAESGVLELWIGDLNEQLKRASADVRPSFDPTEQLGRSGRFRSGKKRKY